jgi:hypothetical protein
MVRFYEVGPDGDDTRVADARRRIKSVVLVKVERALAPNVSCVRLGTERTERSSTVGGVLGNAERPPAPARELAPELPVAALPASVERYLAKTS